MIDSKFSEEVDSNIHIVSKIRKSLYIFPKLISNALIEISFLKVLGNNEVFIVNVILVRNVSDIYWRSWFQRLSKSMFIFNVHTNISKIFFLFLKN